MSLSKAIFCPKTLIVWFFLCLSIMTPNLLKADFTINVGGASGSVSLERGGTYTVVAVPGVNAPGGLNATWATNLPGFVIPGTGPSQTFTIPATATLGSIFTITATEGASFSVLSVTILEQGGLLGQNLAVSFASLDTSTGVRTVTDSIDLVKGVGDDDGEFISVNFSLPSGAPSFLSLNDIYKIEIVAESPTGTELTNIGGLPAFLSMNFSRQASSVRFYNPTIPVSDLTINENGVKDVVMLRYRSMPKIYRYDRIDFLNVVGDSLVDAGEASDDLDNYHEGNWGNRHLDPRISYDYLRNKLFFPGIPQGTTQSTVALTVYNPNVATPATAESFLTDTGALVNLSNVTPDWRPSATPSVNASVSFHGATTTVNYNRFFGDFSGKTKTFDIPMKALPEGGNGTIGFVIKVYSSETSIAKTAELRINVVSKLPSMTMELIGDADNLQFNQGGSVTIVPGKDVNIRAIINRTVTAVGGKKTRPDYETRGTGMGEFVKVTVNGGSPNDYWFFKNFDDSRFDFMEFNPDPHGTAVSGGDTEETDPAVLLRGILPGGKYVHHGLRLNIQEYNGARSNPLFNDIPFLIGNDGDPYQSFTAGGDFGSSNRYLVNNSTTIGLIVDNNTLYPTQLFKYSQARLHTLSANRREGLTEAPLNFALNLFGQTRSGIRQRPLTFIPRVPGLYTINVTLYSSDGLAVLDTQGFSVNCVQEIITINENATPHTGLGVNPIRPLDLIQYNYLDARSEYDEFGLFYLFFELVAHPGTPENILWNNDIYGSNPNGQTRDLPISGEVDLDDINYFDFGFGTEDLTRVWFYYRSPADGGVIGRGGGFDLDGDFFSNEGLYEVTGRPEPPHLLGNGLDDDNDGVVDDTFTMPAGRAQSAAIRTGMLRAGRSQYYEGGYLTKHSDLLPLEEALETYRNSVVFYQSNTLNSAAITALNTGISTVQTAASGVGVTTSTAPVTNELANMLAAITTAGGSVPTSIPLHTVLMRNLNTALAVYEDNALGYAALKNRIGPNGVVRDDFATIPSLTGVTVADNYYQSRVTTLNQYTVSSPQIPTSFGSPGTGYAMKVTGFYRMCVPLKANFFYTGMILPWINRNGNTGNVPLRFSSRSATGGGSLAVNFRLRPSSAVTDRKFVTPFADPMLYQTFVNQELPSGQRNFQNFATTFMFRELTQPGFSFDNFALQNFGNRLNNNYRRNISNVLMYAGLNGWVLNYSGTTAQRVLVQGGAPKIWTIEDRVGPILDLPDAIYTIVDPNNFSYARTSSIIIPEEDVRYRPDNVLTQGVESWFRSFPIQEVVSTESDFITQLGIDRAYDAVHSWPAPAREHGAIPFYDVFYSSPSPAMHEWSGNNASIRLFLPSEMLDYEKVGKTPFAFYEDTDDNGLFNIAVDELVSSGVMNPTPAVTYIPLTRSYFYRIFMLPGTYWDDKYDDLYDFFVVTRFDSGYPDEFTGPPPFNTAIQPDNSAIRFGAHIEVYVPNATPKTTTHYLNLKDHDGKYEPTSNQEGIVVNIRKNADDVDLHLDLYHDTDHPLSVAGYVTPIGGDNVYQLVGMDVTGASQIEQRLTETLVNMKTPYAQKIGTVGSPLVSFKAPYSDFVLLGDADNPPLFPPSAQGAPGLTQIRKHLVHLQNIPTVERVPNYFESVERSRSWRNDVFAVVRPYEKDLNGNGISDANEDFNSDGDITQDVVVLHFTPEKYEAGHPKAGLSYYNPDPFLNMADIRWSIVKNESGSHLSSETGFISEPSTGRNSVTYYPGSVNGLDYIKGENIKTGRSLIAAILVRNNVHTDAIDNDGDANSSYSPDVTTIGALMGLSSSDPRYGIRCFNPATGLGSGDEASMIRLMRTNIDVADDSHHDAAGSLDTGYQTAAYSYVTVGATNAYNVTLNLSGTYSEEFTTFVTMVAESTGAVGTSSVEFLVTYVNTSSSATSSANLILNATNMLPVFTDSNGEVTFASFSPLGGTITTGDTFSFYIFAQRDFDGDGYTRLQERLFVPAATVPESGYMSGLDIDLSWNNPRPFYAIKVRADKVVANPVTDWDGEYGQDFVFVTSLRTNEFVGQGVWGHTLQMALEDLRYIGGPVYGGGVAWPDPIGFPSPVPYEYNDKYRVFRSTNMFNNTFVRTYTASNAVVIMENDWVSGLDLVAQQGTDLIVVSEKPEFIIRGEWFDLTGDPDAYYATEYCGLGPDMTVDGLGQLIYDFDVANRPGDTTRFFTGVMKVNHTIAEYSSAGYGLLRIDADSMPTPVLQLNLADTSDPVTLSFSDGERLQKIRVNFLPVRGFEPSRSDHSPNANFDHSDLAPLTNDPIGGISLWKDNKDPTGQIFGGTDFRLYGRTLAVGSIGVFDPLIDIVVDMDGYDSSRAYINFTTDYSNPINGVPLTAFTATDKVFFIDRDGSKSYSLGDDIYIDEGIAGLDSSDKIIYTQFGLSGTGKPYSLADTTHNDKLKYYDANGNGSYDNGEDIVFEHANSNGIWDLPVDEYVPLDKDALRWRFDNEHKIWYIVLDLENGEEVPPEDVFTDLSVWIHPSWVLPPAGPGGPRELPLGEPVHFYMGADYHICIRTSKNIDYNDAFMVEVPDYYKHTQALSDFDDVAGVWLSSQPQAHTYPSLPGTAVTSPIIVANFPVLISDEATERPTKNRIGRNSDPFAVLGLNLVDNSFNTLKLGNDTLKQVFMSNNNTMPGSVNNLRLNTIENNRVTILEDLVVEFFDVGEGSTGGVSGTGSIVPGDFNPVVDLLALDPTTRGDDVFRSADGTGRFNPATDTKILRLGSYGANGIVVQDDLTPGKQGKQDPNIVFVDINSNGVYDDNLDILVYDIDGVTLNGLPTGVRTFRFGDAILKRGFSNWDITPGAINDVARLTPNDLSSIIGRELKYDSSLWYEDDDESGGFSNEISVSGVALYRDRSDGSPYDNGKFDVSISSDNEVIVLDEYVYIQQIEYTGATGQPQYQVRIRPAFFDISPTLLPLLANGLADPNATDVDHFVRDFARTATDTYGGSGFNFRNSTLDALVNPYTDLNGNGKDDSNRLYVYNKDTALPDYHPMRAVLFENKSAPRFGDENGFGPYGPFGGINPPMDDGIGSPIHKKGRAVVRNTGNSHLGPDYFVVLRTSNVATNGDDFKIGVSGWGRDPAHLINFLGIAERRELGVRAVGFDDRIEDFEPIGPGGGVNSANPFLYPGPPLGESAYSGSRIGDVTNSRTYTKFLSSRIVVDGQAPDDVRSATADIFSNSVPLVDQIELKWEFQSSVDPDRAGVLIVRRKGAAPDLSKVEDGRFYIGPEITLEVGEARRKFIRGYLGFATTTTLKSNISIGSQLSSALDSTIVSITHADFANYPQPPSGGVCYMHLGATTNSPAEIVAYSSVNASGVTTIQRGQLGTSAVSHPSSVPVSFYPPRPVAITEKMGEESPISGFPVTIKVNVSVGGLRGFPSVGVIRVGSEYMSYDSITFGSTQDTMNISQRGLNSSTISPHSSGAKIRWAYHPTYTSDTIVVESTSGFPNSGRLKIGDEEMWYNYKTPTTFHGIVRGIHTDDANKTDTIVSAHSIGVEVMDSLYKVVMNDQDLDGPSDSNNDGNNDMIATSWVDDIYFGDDPTSYFYYVFTYDDVYNYSQGKFASVNDLRLEQYKEPGGANASTNAQVIFTLSNLAQKIEVSGGDVFYFRVQGGTPKFNWAASESGLSTETAPPGFNNGGEPDRYVYYKVPDRFDVLNKDIIISVTDNSETAQTLSIILNVTFVNEIDPNAFYVTSDKGIPPLKATTDATITINPGDTVTFKMNLPPTSNIANATWFLDPASTFVGVGNITDPLTLVYTATSQTTPGLKDGMDIIIASDGVTTIRITVIIADSVVDRDCVQSEILTVTPGTDGEISVSPGSKVTFTATGGTCNFTWDITANNSVGASLTTSTRGTRAIYTAGTENRTVDIIELSDGVNTKVIKVKIASGTNRSSSGGCFIRSKSRD